MKFNLLRPATQTAIEAVQKNDMIQLDPFKSGDLACLEDLVVELREANGFTICGMTTPIQNLRKKALKL